MSSENKIKELIPIQSMWSSQKHSWKANSEKWQKICKELTTDTQGGGGKG